MASTVTQIQNRLIASLVAYAATLGITINPNDWVIVPGNISETDYKLLLLNTVASAMAFQEQEEDLFQVQEEDIIKTVAPQTPAWFQNQMINVFQFNATDPQLPILNEYLVPSFSPINDDYKVIKYCSTKIGSSGFCLIKVAGQSNGLPVDLDTIAGAGALAAAESFVKGACASPGVNYILSSGNADQLFLQLDVYFTGIFSGVIFDSIKQAIIKFLSTKSPLNPTGVDFAGSIKLSGLEEAILSVQGVQDVVFVNIGARQDSISFVTAYALGYNLITGGTFDGSGNTVTNGTELARFWNTVAGYISLEQTSGKTLEDFRVGSSGKLNLNCIAV